MPFEQQLKESTWKNLVNFSSENTSLQQAPVYCHIPLCIGFNDTFSFENLYALVADIQSKKYAFMIYLNPKDDESYAHWKKELGEWSKKNNDILNRMLRGHVIHMAEWRKNSLRVSSEQAYRAFSKNHIDESTESLIAREIDKFTLRHKGASRDEVRAHLELEAFDYLSWMQKASDTTLRRNVLMYPNTLSHAMHYALKYADQMGYLKDSLVHCKPQYEPQPELQNDDQLFACIIRVGITSKMKASDIAQLLVATKRELQAPVVSDDIEEDVVFSDAVVADTKKRGGDLVEGSVGALGIFSRAGNKSPRLSPRLSRSCSNLTDAEQLVGAQQLIPARADFPVRNGGR